MTRLIPVLALLVGCSDQFENEVGGPKGSNDGGYDGPQHCWDLDGDGEADAGEDTNGDGTVDVYDCRGEDGGGSGSNGSDGQDCWDLDGDGIGDPEEDTNGDGVVDVYDCRDDGGDDTGGGGSGVLYAVQVAVDQFGSCALLGDGSVQCWGRDRSGTMGGHSDGDVSAIAVNDDDPDYRCEVLSDSSARCWTSRTGYPDLSYTGVAEIAVGQVSAICIRDSTGSVECERGDGYSIESPVGNFESIKGSKSGFCGILVGGQVECWDLPVGGDLAAAAAPSTSVEDIDIGLGHWACASNSLNELVCWGRSETDAGSGMDDPTKVPPPGVTCHSPALGANHGCCIEPDGGAYCWGSNVYGQSNAPVGVRFSSLDAAERHTCGVTLAGQVACWGGGDGQSDVPQYLQAD